MISQRVLWVDLKTGSYQIEAVKDPGIIGPIDYGFSRHLNRDELIIGTGVLAGSKIPGTNRLIVSGYSPLWEGFYISTMGGASLIFSRLGINYLVLKGKVPTPSILKLIKKQGQEVQVFKFPLDYQTIWRGYKGKQGVYALIHYIYDHFIDNYSEAPRILAVGPAAEKTGMGGIASVPIRASGLSNADTWAARGGFGSKLFQEHGLVGIIYGGDAAYCQVTDYEAVEALFQKKFNCRMKQKAGEATIKYRFDPKFGTGGTFGVNFTSKVRTRLFAFNYQSIYKSRAERENLHEVLIKNHYLKQFNEEIISNKAFQNCGEPCVAVCKKVWGEYKKDYEPYEALGPNAGVFDQRAAEKLVHYGDVTGFDTIQLGGAVSFFMELLDRKLISPLEFRFTKTPIFSETDFDVVADSMHNAELGCEIIDFLLNPPAGIDLRQGLRVFAKQLAQEKGPSVMTALVSNAASERGWMIPNQYWVPGMFSPMPIMGKYFEYYEQEFVAPRELGRKSAERMVKELYVDNMGICRFHRKWVEEIIEEVIQTVFKEPVDFFKHHRSLASRINLRNQAVFWESERVIDIVKRFHEVTLEEEGGGDELKAWVDKFNQDKMAAAREYWYEIRRGVDEYLAEYPVLT